MAQLPDIVRDSKLITRILSDGTMHVYYESSRGTKAKPTRREERWQRNRQIGSGAYGSVWLERCVAGQRDIELRAVKQISRRHQQLSRSNYSTELEVVATFSHQKYERSFVKSYGWYQTLDSLFITMEYSEFGDLQSYLHNSTPLPEQEAKDITFQLLEGLSFMHENNISHGDLKPSNILVKSRPPERWWVKIGDFGMSKRYGNSLEALSTWRGPLEFKEFELLGLAELASEPLSPLGFAADIWALGETSFGMLTKEPAFQNATQLYRYRLRLEEFPSGALHANGVSAVGAHFISSAMMPSSDARLTVEQALHHEWMKEFMSDPPWYPSENKTKHNRDEADRNSLGISNTSSLLSQRDKFKGEFQNSQTDGLSRSTTLQVSHDIKQLFNDRLKSHLREFRLLKLLPGADNEPVSCELEVVSLDLRPQYEAISYTWGESGLDKTVRLNGIHDIRVTPNVESILRRLRNKLDTRALWIDALCINQFDIQDRNIQVDLMRDIYLYSNRVLVMLVEDGAMPNLQTPAETASKGFQGHENTATEIQMLKQLPLALLHTIDLNHAHWGILMIHLLAQDQHISDIPIFSDQYYRRAALKILQNMVQCRWWNRVWVVQELILAPDGIVFFGDVEIPWNVLSKAAVNYQRHQTTCCKGIVSYLPQEEVDTLSRFSRVVLDFVEVRSRWTEHSQTNLLQLLRQFRRRESTDARDKVFALLGLVNFWGRRRPIMPDYESPVHQVYREVVREMIEVTNSLAVLSGTLNKGPDLPSWIPDWSIPPPSMELQRLGLEGLYNASGGSKPWFRMLGDGVLELRGCEIDVISKTSTVMGATEGDESLLCFKTWYIAAGLVENPGRPYIAGGTWIDAYWRTLCCDVVYNGTFSAMDTIDTNPYCRAGPEYGKSHNVWSCKPNSGTLFQFMFDRTHQLSDGNDGSLSNENITSIASSDTASVNHAIRIATSNRLFFMTNKGYMGIGPPSVNIGDKICVFEGGSVPFILRDGSLENSDLARLDKHILLGDCYVHGVMDGELFSCKKIWEPFHII